MQEFWKQIKTTISSKEGIGGSILCILGLWDSIWWVIKKLWGFIALMGDIDFLATAMDQNWWIVESIGKVITDPPGWFRLLLIIGGISLIYYKTKSQGNSLGLSGSLAVAKVPGTKTSSFQGQHHIVGELIIESPPATKKTIEEMGVEITGYEAPPHLGIKLENKKQIEPVKDCEIFIKEFLIWRDGKKVFAPSPEFETASYFPIKTDGPCNLFLEAPQVFYFIQTSENNTKICINVKNPGPNVVQFDEGGLWRATLQIKLGEETIEEFFYFSWKKGETIKFMGCGEQPTD